MFKSVLLTPYELVRLLGDTEPAIFKDMAYDNEWTIGPISAGDWRRVLQAQIRKVRRLEKP